jgi:hypothetical protein
MRSFRGDCREPYVISSHPAGDSVPTSSGRVPGFKLLRNGEPPEGGGFPTAFWRASRAVFRRASRAVFRRASRAVSRRASRAVSQRASRAVSQRVSRAVSQRASRAVSRRASPVRNYLKWPGRETRNPRKDFITIRSLFNYGPLITFSINRLV